MMFEGTVKPYIIKDEVVQALRTFWILHMDHEQNCSTSTVRLVDSAKVNSRHLYPNINFYSGITLRAIGIPKQMFPVMFAIGRLPGWIAQWLESIHDPDWRINRPRQVYVGLTEQPYPER
ncbi:MAG: hypothetical protein K9L23_18380 [Desulfotignum sp.]|nr:hypothetical protein [Desulfotignum sp.]